LAEHGIDPGGRPATGAFVSTASPSQLIGQSRRQNRPETQALHNDAGTQGYKAGTPAAEDDRKLAFS